MLLDRAIPFSFIFGKVKYDLLYISLIGVSIHYITVYFKEFLPVMPLTIPAFLGTSISVLLSFKLNQSYDRWWEARKVWGAIVNDSRSLVLQLQLHVSKERKSTISQMAYRQIAWCYSLGQTLRGLDPLEKTNNYLSRVDFAEISSHHNKPLAILQLNNNALRRLSENGNINIYSRVLIDETFVRLCDSMGKAERINNTVFPSTYRLFLHYVIYLFVITLSVALRDVDMTFEIPLLVLISACFFLLEKSAYHLQDPFRNRASDVSVTAIAQTIEVNIKQLLGEEQIIVPEQPDSFYIL
jgi:ion channel-forming bestrophin family protein